MTPASFVREARRRHDRSKDLAEKGWYHSFELPDGTVIEGVNPLEAQRRRYARFPIPTDLRGKRVLDIGTWDGWFAFEAERRGAAVTAVDCVETSHFRDLHRRLGSSVDYRILDVYELPAAGLGKFDIVFLLGVLYHLRHPLLALETVCSLATDVVIVDSFVADGDTWRDHADAIPTMEFYETNELANQFDNWVGPSVSCLMAMCRAAGFARVELLHTESANAAVACYRNWEPPLADAAEAPEIVCVANNADLGINFTAGKEQHLMCWFRTPRQVTRQDLCLEAGEYGAAAIYAGREQDDCWLANFPLPRGLSPGMKEVRLRLADSSFGEAARIAVDMSLQVSQVVCEGARDAITWNADEVSPADDGYLVCWIAGLPENADRNNTRVRLGREGLLIQWMGMPDEAGHTQINALVPGTFPKGRYDLRVECGGVTSEPRPVRVV